MNDAKPLVFSLQRKTSEAVSNPEPTGAANDVSQLPVSNWDDYKSWCEKVKENWDVN